MSDDIYPQQTDNTILAKDGAQQRPGSITNSLFKTQKDQNKAFATYADNISVAQFKKSRKKGK